MGSNIIYRGSSPRIVCNLNGDMTSFHCFFSMGVEFNHSQFTINDGQMQKTYDSQQDTTVLEFTLSQEQTCRLKAGKALAQFRAVDSADSGMVSNVVEVEVKDILKDGIIRYE